MKRERKRVHERVACHLAGVVQSRVLGLRLHGALELGM